MMFDRKRAYVFGGAASFWYVFIAGAVFIWLSPLFIPQAQFQLKTLGIGAVLFLIGICFRFMYDGIQVDSKQNRTREYTSILGFRKGVWQDLPPLQKVSLFSKDSTTWNTSNGISPTFRSTRTRYIVALYSTSSKPVVTIATENKKSAQNDLKLLAEMFRLPAETSL